MATKTIKSQAGNSFYENAAKSCPWKVDIKERLIFVAPEEMNEAKENLFVCFLCNKEHGFHIQLTIDAIKKPEFKPLYRNKIVHEPEKGEFNIGDKYVIQSTKTAIELISISGKEFVFKYLNSSKVFLVGADNIRRNLNLEVWRLLNQ